MHYASCSPSRVSPGSGVDVRFGVIVDTPQPLLAAAPVSGADGGGGPGGGGGGGRAELDALRDEHLGRMRLRWVGAWGMRARECVCVCVCVAGEGEVGSLQMQCPPAPAAHTTY